jgi:hypothetical protein
MGTCRSLGQQADPGLISYADGGFSEKSQNLRVAVRKKPAVGSLPDGLIPLPGSLTSWFISQIMDINLDLVRFSEREPADSAKITDFRFKRH